MRMAQVKIYGVRDFLRPIQKELSDVIHTCLVDSLGLPQEKKFHRFFNMAPGDFVFPVDRTEKYTIIEISMFEGRSTEVKKKLINLIFGKVGALGIQKNDIEITIFETPRENWGIRGLQGDELPLNYKVDV